MTPATGKVTLTINGASVEALNRAFGHDGFEIRRYRRGQWQIALYHAGSLDFGVVGPLRWCVGQLLRKVLL